MSSNKTINQFPTDIVLTGTEYILGMSENVTIKLVLDDIKGFILSGQSSGTTGVYITGATYDNLTGTLNLVDSSGTTIPVTGFYTGGTFVESITDDGNGVVVINNSDPLNPILEFTGITTDGVTILGTGLSGDPITVNPEYYSLSDLGFVVTPNVSNVINQNVTLPENSTVTYPSPLTIGAGYTLTVPATTTLTII